jgi:hypothetical protein
VVYEVHATNADGSESRFEYRPDEPFKEGNPIYHEMASYAVVRVLAEQQERWSRKAQRRSELHASLTHRLRSPDTTCGAGVSAPGSRVTF